MPIAVRADALWGGSLTATSDYRVRGLSKTRGDAAVQGGIHAHSTSGWFLGAWASSISRARNDTTLEIDAYLGLAANITPDWDTKVVATHYDYPDGAGTNYAYDELSVSLAFRSRLIGTVSWSPNMRSYGRYQQRWDTESGTSICYELTGLQPLTSGLSFSAGVGYSDLTDLFDSGYWYWNTGISYTLGALQLDVSRIDSDAAAEQLFGERVTQATWSAAVSWRF